MANHKLFLVIGLASVLYFIDCSSLNELPNAAPDATSDRNASHPSNVTTTSTPPTPANVTTPSSHNTTTTTASPTTKSSTTTSTTSTLKPITTVSTTSPPSTTTPSPPSTTTPPNKHDRSFDLPSFIGGVILSLGLAAIGYVVYKFYKTRTDPNYRSL